MPLLNNVASWIIEWVIVALASAIPISFFLGKRSLEKKITREVKFGKGQKRGHKDVFVTVKIAYNGKKRGHLHPVAGAVKIEKT